MINKFLPAEYFVEEFVNFQTLDTHFKKHCLAGELKKSKKTNVYYDFNNIDEYKTYEQQLNNVFTNGNIIIINSLYDTQKINISFNKLLTEDTYILFTADCRLINNQGNMLLGVHSFANSATTNYNGSTIDFNILAEDKNENLVSISLFPLDISQLEHTFNNFVEQHYEYTNTKALRINKEDK